MKEKHQILLCSPRCVIIYELPSVDFPRALCGVITVIWGIFSLSSRVCHHRPAHLHLRVLLVFAQSELAFSFLFGLPLPFGCSTHTHTHTYTQINAACDHCTRICSFCVVASVNFSFDFRMSLSCVVLFPVQAVRHDFFCSASFLALI